MPCDISTAAGIKWCKDERYVDFVEFRNYSIYGKYMKIFINKFFQELAWSRFPSQLSLPSLRTKYSKLVELLNNLLRLARRLYLKSQERLEYTRTIYKKLKEIINKIGKHTPYSLYY